MKLAAVWNGKPGLMFSVKSSPLIWPGRCSYIILCRVSCLKWTLFVKWKRKTKFLSLIMLKFDLLWNFEQSKSAHQVNLACFVFLNSLEPSDAIWRWRSWSTLVQVMACCLTAPSHYLNQYWLIISKVQWHPSESNFTRDASAISHWN